MKKCFYCSSLSEDNEEFCPKCGAPFGNIENGAQPVPAEKQQETALPVNAVPDENQLPVAKPARRGMTTTGMIFSIVGLVLIMIFTLSIMDSTSDNTLVGAAVIAFIPAVLAVLGVIFSAATMKRSSSKGKNITGLICGGLALMRYIAMVSSCLVVTMTW